MKEYRVFNLENGENELFCSLVCNSEFFSVQIKIDLCDFKIVNGDLIKVNKILNSYSLNIINASIIEICLENKEFLNEILIRTKYSSLNNPSVISMSEVAQKLKHLSYIGISDEDSIQGFSEWANLSDLYGFNPIFGMTTNFFVKYDPFQNLNILHSKIEDSIIYVIDLETNGVFFDNAYIFQLSWYEIHNGNKLIEGKNYILHEENDVDLLQSIQKLTGISNDIKISEGIDRQKILKEFFDLLKDPKSILVSHKKFDLAFLNYASLKYFEKKLQCNYLDSEDMHKLIFPERSSFSFYNTCLSSGVHIDTTQVHNAFYDAKLTSICFLKLLNSIGISNTWEFVKNNYKLMNKHYETYKISILVKEAIGFQNLNKIISYSNLTDNFYKFPRTDLDFLLEHKEGLLFISLLDINSYIWNAFFYNVCNIDKVIEIFDFISLPHFNTFRQQIIYRNYTRDVLSIEDGLNDIKDFKGPDLLIKFLSKNYFKKLIINSMPSYLFLEESVCPIILKSIVSPLANYKHFNKLGNADCIYDFSEWKDCLEQLDLNLFELEINKKTFLDKIPKDLKMYIHCKLRPLFRKDYFSEIIEILTYQGEKKYGNAWININSRAFEEIEKLSSNKLFIDIFYLTYTILNSIRKEFNVLISSRGTVGSSFTAFILDITEVNPLQSHAFCKNCGFLKFFDEEVYLDVKYQIICDCGEKLKFDGFSIDFSMFSGLHADKLPDIDLNIEADSKHSVREFVIDFVKREFCLNAVIASSVLTLKQKSALVYINKFFAGIQCNFNREFLANRLANNKLVTTQHPGGIFLFPDNEDISYFAALQRAKEYTVTHQNYKDLGNNLFKLDLLGHEDPAVLKKLLVSSRLSIEDIIIDKNVLYLFKNCMTLGLPEMGTILSRELLNTLKINSFSDILKILGFSHGINVWTNNAKNLYLKENIPLENLIAFRDDVFNFLKSRKLSNEQAFEISEFIRKGGIAKNLKKWEYYEKILLDLNVPQYYLKSCSKITYLFPKAHAAAYFLMSARIAYFKINFPDIFFVCYFNRKIKYLDHDFLLNNKVYLSAHSKDMKDKICSQVAEVIKELSIYNITLEKTNIFYSQPLEFSVINNKIFPPLIMLKGLGEDAAIKIRNTLIDKESFDMSLNEFVKKSKLSKSKLDILKQNNLLPFKEIKTPPLF